MAAPKQSITPQMFADAVAAVQRDGPGAIRGKSWTRKHLTLAEISGLTGLSYSSIRNYEWKARTGRETSRPFPAARPDGKYAASQVIVWHATRDNARSRKGNADRWRSHGHYHPALRALVDRSGGRVTQRAVALELGLSASDRRLCATLLREIGASPPRRATDEEVMPFLRELAAQGDRTRTLQEVSAALDEAGLHMHAGRVSRLYVKAGGRMLDLAPSDDDELTPLESTRWDGLVSQAQIAKAYGVSGSQVAQAREAGHITWDKKQQYSTDRDGRPMYRYFYDPKKLTTRRDMRRGPVMKGHKLAVEEGT